MLVLTPQMKKFGQEWINKRDTKKAAILAGVPVKSAKKIGDDWIKLPQMVRFINSEIDASAIKTKVTREWILEQTVKVYQFSARDEVKLQALNLLDRIQTKIDEQGLDENRPTIQIVSEGGLTIL